MGGNGNAVADNLVRLRPEKDTGRASEKKWGKEVIALGFRMVPSLLMRAQNPLGLNPTQLAVLMQPCDFWWERDRKPYPGKAILAERLGLSPRQVQRHIADLETVGFVERVERRAIHGGKLTNIYDLGGLLGRLKKLEPEFREVDEAARTARMAVSKRGYRRNRTGGAAKPS